MDAARPGRSRLEVSLAIVAFALVGWLLACLVNTTRERAADDAFITYIYGRNLAEGHGLRYNASDPEPTAGTSSTLHVLLCAAATRLDLDLLAFTRLIGIAGMLGMGLVFGLVGAHVARAPPAAGCLAGLAVVLVWSSMPESEVHCSSGMETLIFTALHGCAAAWATWVACDDRGGPLGWTRSVAGGVVLALLVLARPEGWLLAFGYLGALAFVRRVPGGAAAAARSLLPVAVPLALGVVALLCWRWAYFGDVFGNAYYIKVANAIFGSSGDLLPGLRTTLRFLLMRSLPLTALALALAAAVQAPSEALRRAAWLLVPSFAVVLSYSRAIHEMAGGFRYEYPMLAPLACALVVGLCALRRRAPARFATTVGLGAIALPLLASSSSPQIATWVEHPRSAAIAWWPAYVPQANALGRLGLDLAETGLGERATILLSGAGQTPYYSRFRAIDWIGLNHNRICGREPMSIDELWSYLDAQAPDLMFSILPPAAPGSSRREDDPNFNSAHVQRTLSGRGSALFEHWDPELLAQSFWHEMQWIRDHCEFGASYQLGPAWGGDWWVLVYVRRDSPHRALLLKTLARSRRVDSGADLGSAFPYDPRRLGEHD